MAHLLVVELPGGNDTDLLQAAIADGHDVTFLSADLGHYRARPDVDAVLRSARERIEVAPFDYDDVERRVLALHCARPVDAVLCLIDTRMPEAARLARRLGLRHLDPDAATLLRDKARVRARLVERGIPQPEFRACASNDDLRRAVAEIGLPVLIKPADGYGSQNIVMLRHPEDLEPPLSPLDELLPCFADYGLGARASGRMIVERCLEGSIVGCDTFTAAGSHTLLGVHEKLFFDPPSFAIRGGCFSPDGPQFDALRAYLFAVLDAAGFDWGAAHTEIALTRDGPRLIEINPRLVGAKIPRLVSATLGRSVHADLIALHLGRWRPPTRAPAPMVGVTRWIVADQAGTLADVRIPPSGNPAIRCTEILRMPGEAVRPPYENADRIGYVIACASSREEAERIADEHVRRTRIRLHRPGHPPSPHGRQTDEPAFARP
ncbi:MAG: ATP-grasp domain-containing protein [Betaproteobacteria bacterium]|nr:ATP-grasp domain-containing protein [Betaproteobacteria bacterium]